MPMSPRSKFESYPDSIAAQRHLIDYIDYVNYIDLIDQNSNSVIYLALRAREIRRSRMATSKKDRVYAAIKAQILSGDLPSGHKMPSTRLLQEQYGISYGTLNTVINMLKAEKLLVGYQATPCMSATSPVNPRKTELDLRVSERPAGRSSVGMVARPVAVVATHFDG